MPAEAWRPVVGYEGYYEVSDMGRVRSIDRMVQVRGQSPRRLRGRVMSANGDQGRLLVVLSKGEEDRNMRRRRRVAHLVLEAFVSPRPEGAICCHWDDDPSNNRVGNLRWGTESDNRWDAVRNRKHHQVRKTHCPQGHEYNEENTKVIPSRPTARYCRQCHRDRRWKASR